MTKATKGILNQLKRDGYDYFDSNQSYDVEEAKKIQKQLKKEGWRTRIIECPTGIGKPHVFRVYHGV